MIWESVGLFEVRLRLDPRRTGKYIQGVPGGKDLTSGECSLGQTIPI